MEIQRHFTPDRSNQFNNSKLTPQSESSTQSLSNLVTKPEPGRVELVGQKPAQTLPGASTGDTVTLSSTASASQFPTSPTSQDPVALSRQILPSVLLKADLGFWSAVKRALSPISRLAGAANLTTRRRRKGKRKKSGSAKPVAAAIPEVSLENENPMPEPVDTDIAMTDTEAVQARFSPPSDKPNQP